MNNVSQREYGIHYMNRKMKKYLIRMIALAILSGIATLALYHFPHKKPVVLTPIGEQYGVPTIDLRNVKFNEMDTDVARLINPFRFYSSPHPTYEEFVKYMINEKGIRLDRTIADVDPIFYQMYFLGASISDQSAALIRTLIENGARVNCTNGADKYTPLMYATWRASVGLIEYLLERGADPNECTVNGTTPLMLATKRKRLDVARILIAAGAKLNAQDNNGWTAIMWAAFVKDQNLENYYIEQGADKTGVEQVRPIPGGDDWGKPRVICNYLSHPSF